jgi:hypothetical protein
MELWADYPAPGSDFSAESAGIGFHRIHHAEHQLKENDYESKKACKRE